MKKTILTLITYLILLLPLSGQEVIDWDAVIDRYIEKYQPTEVPQWIFPMIFENGFGERDTLYYGYDKDSENDILEEKYGETCISVDSTSFKAYWSICMNGGDTLNVIDNFIGEGFNGHSIEFNNGRMPITVYYNDAFFYSDSVATAHPDLPSSPPYVQGEVRDDIIGVALGRWDKVNDEWETQCGWAQTLAMMDSFPNAPISSIPICTLVPDSFHIQDITPDNFIYTHNLAIKMRPWTGSHVSVQQVEKYQAIIGQPNPADQFFSVELSQAISGRLFLYTLSGTLIKQQSFTNSSNLSMNTSDLTDGVYFFKIESPEEGWYGKVLVVRQ